MKKTQMKKTIAIATGLLLATGLFANKAQAGSVDVDFTGTVTSFCNLTLMTVAKLAVSNSSSTEMTSNPALGTDATFGQVILDCNTDATMTISNPFEIDPIPDQESKEAYLYRSDGMTVIANSSGTITGTVLANDVDKTFNVDVWVKSTMIIPPNTYKYKVTVTATPN